MGKAALYRFFGHRGQLLYAGKSVNPFHRFGEHIQTKPCITDVAHVEIEWFDDEATAMAAERAAIQQGRPLWNKRDKPPPRQLTKTDFPIIRMPLVYYGPPKPETGRGAVITDVWGDRHRPADQWESAIRISRPGEMIRVDVPWLPDAFYRAAMEAGVYVV